MTNGGADGALPGQRRRRSIFRDDATDTERPNPWGEPGGPAAPSEAASDGTGPAGDAPSDGLPRSIFRPNGHGADGGGR